MEPQVSLEVVLESEAQATGLTHEGFLPGVDHPMLQQPHLALEGLVTLAALVRPLLRVRPLVDAQVAGSGEPLPAGGAGVWPGTGVDGLVLAEALLPGEAFPADVAHEGLDLSVRHFMVPECAGRRKRAVAGEALQRCFLQPVRRLVDSELAQQSELPVTLVATQQLVGVLLLSLPQLVSQLVPLQRLGLVETFVAGAAGERLDVAGDVFPQLVPLVEAFVTELTEEPLVFVELPPPLPLQLLLLLFTQSYIEQRQTPRPDLR